MCEHGFQKFRQNPSESKMSVFGLCSYGFLRHSYVTCSFHLGGLPEPARTNTLNFKAELTFFSPTAWLLQVSHYFTSRTADRFARYPAAAPASPAHQKQHTTAPLRTTPQLIPPPTSLSPQARPRQWWHRLSSSWAKLLNGRKINTTEMLYSAKRKAERSHGWLYD